MTDSLGPYSHFRLNLEQQKKRAKELLKAARAGDHNSLARFKSPPGLAEAQFLIAKELRFDNWASLKRHISEMTRERAVLSEAPFDGDKRTLHIRCGSDLRMPLQQAGFRGDFYEHAYPYLIGPVREGPGSLEQRARFLTENFAESRDPPLEYASVLEELGRDERQLADSAGYERVVVWSEFDCYDQLVLVRILSHYAMHRRPELLELINIGEFPGAIRFIGLGQLPPEALRLLWTRRKPATPAALRLGLQAWRALCKPNPRDLAAIMRSGTRALPLLAKALHRHLRELPSLLNGLSFTEQMTLQLLTENEMSLNDLFTRLTYERDPLPGQGDLQILKRVLDMETAHPLVFERRANLGRDGKNRSPWTDTLTITAIGRDVLKGNIDFRTLRPTDRWVGGVQVGSDFPDWRWNEQTKDAETLGATEHSVECL